MERPKSRAGFAALAFVALTTATAAASSAGSAVFHERKEVAGLAVVFGAEPEPALTDEVQFLRWRVSALADSAAYTEMRAAEVVIMRDGSEFGPFQVQGVGRDPGLYQTRHVFTAAGEYESVLRFRKGADPQVHSIAFNFRIGDRGALEIPTRKPGGP
jgi:hypothetical protein